MENKVSETIKKHFGTIPEPRLERTRLYELPEILFIAICGIICGAESWEDIADFGRDQEAWLRTVLSLANGIPSHDTFRRVFGLISAVAFQKSFISWVQAVSRLTQGQVIAVDGKKPRGSQDKGIGKEAIDMVSAWATENQLVLGQVKVDDKSNEITAMPELLRMLVITGCIVTTDAMGCQVEVAQTCVDQHADYVLALKENQGNLYQDVNLLFADLESSQYQAYPNDYAHSFDNTHGRAEKRQCWTIADREVLQQLRGANRWPNLCCVAQVRRTYQDGSEQKREDRFFISSLSGQGQQLLGAVRAHWQVENNLHWVLDIAFREDDCRVRKDQGPQNFAVLRHIALNLLKAEKTSKRSIKSKRLQAAWKTDYREKVLAGFANLSELV
jgi:predicted transposase YbfD/YdcC